MIQVYCYDEQGFFTISKYVEELEENMTTETWQGLYKPKWSGTEWIEGATQEYIDSLKNNDVVELTTDEKIAQMAEQLLKTQTELKSAQEALDFIIMGGI